MISSLSDRAHYNSLADAIYLNQASLGLTGQPAVSAMHAYLDDIGRHGNMNLTDAQEVGLFTPLRKNAAALMNCPPEQLAIMSSAGEMLSQLPYLFNVPAGGKFLSVSTDFPAITRPWIGYAETHDIALQFVDEKADIDLTDALIDAIDESTSVVAVSYVQFSTGTRCDVYRLRAATRKVGAYLVVDVTQAAGAVPIDAKGWEADIVVCSGYKWLGGQGGVGLAVVAPALIKQTPPAPGWMGAPDPFDMQATKLPLADDARRFTQSTMSYISMAGLTVALGELLSMGAVNIEAHAQSLAKLLDEELKNTGWTPFRSIDDKAASAHIITLGNPTGNVENTLMTMRNANIVCGSRNRRIRVSIAHFNDETDIQALVKILQQA
ncbi:MAG: aminotransferase class V-fold PLP-dependent enzyme [Rhizobiales bacterium]|nr:aminotransferase class V-fold PLP-dependent enzyme [Hyphomicrobiales bacterium]NRB14516.1 aminotransferase class V-fold PLP-dependent enzyme [Hyphomicrobiales bacterium]